MLEASFKHSQDFRNRLNYQLTNYLIFLRRTDLYKLALIVVVMLPEAKP